MRVKDKKTVTTASTLLHALPFHQVPCCCATDESQQSHLLCTLCQVTPSVRSGGKDTKTVTPVSTLFHVLHTITCVLARTSTACCIQVCFTPSPHWQEGSWTEAGSSSETCHLRRQHTQHPITTVRTLLSSPCLPNVLRNWQSGRRCLWRGCCCCCCCCSRRGVGVRVSVRGGLHVAGGRGVFFSLSLSRLLSQSFPWIDGDASVLDLCKRRL